MSQFLGPPPPRPGTRSRSWPRPTSTIEVTKLGPEVGGGADEGRLVEAECVDLAEAARVVDQHLAVGDDDVVDRVPVTTELRGHLVDRAALAPNVLGRPQCCAPGQLHPRVGDPVVLLGPAAIRAVGVLAAPSPLVPVQRDRS